MPEDGEAFTPVHFINPKPGGGSFIDRVSNGLGEPLNVTLFASSLCWNKTIIENKKTKQVIISSLSSPWVSDGGFVHFANAIGF
jgi:hypothetical protein